MSTDNWQGYDEPAASRRNRRRPTAVQRTTTCGPGGSAIYGLGIFGALVYFWQQADGFWEHLYAIFEAVFWPAYMVFEAFTALG